MKLEFHYNFEFKRADHAFHKKKKKINNGTQEYETRVPFNTRVLEKQVRRQRVQN